MTIFSIGLIKVDRDIEFNDYVQPIPLVRRRIIGSGSATLTGFGAKAIGRDLEWYEMPEKLQFMNTNIMTNFECSIRARIFGNFENLLPSVPTIYTGHICTFKERGTGLCFGDSGSLLINEQGAIGVTVTGVLLCARGGPDIFIRISTYIDWIDLNVQDLN